MPLIIPSNSISGEFEVANSLRFDDGSSDYLSKTYGSAGNTKKWTWSCWFKKSDIPATWTGLIEAGSGSQYFSLGIDGSERLILASQDEGAGGVMNLWSSQLIRDISAWYHFVVAYDSAQATSSDRVKGYINGEQITSFNTANYPAQNKDTYLNGAYEHRIGKRISGTNYNGYMAEVCFIDGQALDPTSFGEFDEDTGIWKPIDVSGLTFGTNGFYLDFENSGSLGADVSGNGNNFTVNNLTSIDQVTDTPTNNFATMNPLDNYYANSTFSEGNCKIVTGSSSFAVNTSTFGLNSGKWYMEMKATSIFNGYSQLGIRGKVATSTSDNAGQGIDGYTYVANGGNVVNNNSSSAYGTTWNSGDIIGMAIDLDNNFIYWSRNGTWQNSGDPESGSSGTGAGASLVTPTSGFYYVACSDNDSGATNTFEFNFGNPPFSISSGNSDGNGYGNFEYSVPSGYYALNTKNLAEYG